MRPHGPLPTLGQYLQQARAVQALSLRQVAARVYRADGRPITPKYLQLLEHDRRRPALPVALQLATVLALDPAWVLTLAHQGEAVVRRYLQAWPEAEHALIVMLLHAEQRGFVAWDGVTRRLLPAEASPATDHRRPATRRRTRRVCHARSPQSPAPPADH